MSTAERWVIVDGHEDLAMGVLADGRDYLSSAPTIRATEAEAAFENPNGSPCSGSPTGWRRALR